VWVVGLGLFLSGEWHALNPAAQTVGGDFSSETISNQMRQQSN